jgi:glucose-1-phosphate thymidylyltransferase
VSLGRGCVIRNSSIENTIVMDETVIADCPGIRDSMIGRFARIIGAPEGSKFTLGDHSQFEGPA